MKKGFKVCSRYIVLLLYCSLLALVLSCSQSEVMGQSIDTWLVVLLSDKDGLPSNSITDVLQDKEGYIWIASDDGLCRYDGITFKKFRRIEGDSNSIQCNNILDIAIDHQQNIWYGSTDGRVGYYKQSTHTFVNFKGPEIGLPANEWLRLFVDSKGKVWIGFWRLGLYYFDEATSRFIHAGNLNGIDSVFYKLARPGEIQNLNSVNDISEDKNGNFWLATYDGLYTFNPENFDFDAIRKPRDTEYKSDGFVCMYQDSRGIWLGSVFAGLSLYNPQTQQWKNYMYAEWGRPRNNIRCIKRKSDSELWIGTDDKGWGVFNINTGKFSFPISFGFHCPNIMVDYSGVAWFASRLGLYKYSQTPGNSLSFETLSIKDAASTFNTSGFYHDLVRRKLYYGTVYADGLHVRDEVSGTEKTWKGDVGIEGYGRGMNVHYITLDPLDTLWILSENFVYIFDRKKERLAKYIVPATGEKRPFFSKLLRSTTGDIWIASYREGVFQFNHKTKKLNAHKQVSEGIYGLAEDKSGSIWMICRKGLAIYSYKDNDFKKFFLNNDSTIVATGITSSANGDIWISTQENGLYQYKPSSGVMHLVRWTVAQGLPSDVVHNITASPNGSIWGISPTTVFSLDPLSGRVRSLQHHTNLTNLALFADAENTIFVEATAGFLVYDPKKDTVTTPPPKLVINSIKLFDEELPFQLSSNSQSPLQLEYNQNFLTFEYAALDFRDPVKNQYMYRLDGVDNDWINAGNRTNVAYANLSPGQYTFRLKAANSLGIWTEKEVGVSLNIDQPFWEKWYFKLLLGAITVAVAVIIYKVKMANIEAVARIREKISRDLHDEMGSNLSTINILSNVARGEAGKGVANGKVKEMLDRISSLSVHALESVDEIVWSLNPQNDSFEEMIARMRSLGAQILEDQGINFMFDAEGDPKFLQLDIERRTDLYLIYKESINNICKYAKCKNVYVKLLIGKDLVKLVVADDGIGFKTETLSDGNGLNNMKARSENLKGKLRIESELNKGTRLELDISTHS
jgi:ligand-binding sensor domain-containing protein/two-component sensor histidine kinase